jgi:hypothetical protein
MPIHYSRSSTVYFVITDGRIIGDDHTLERKKSTTEIMNKIILLTSTEYVSTATEPPQLTCQVGIADYIAISIAISAGTIKKIVATNIIHRIMVSTKDEVARTDRR